MTQTSPQFERGTKYLLWDGDCGFCARCAELARRLNEGGFVIVPYQSLAESELRPFGLSQHKCSQELKTIAASGRVLGGAFALNYFLWHHSRWRVLILLLHLFPILILAEVLAYRLVAENRGVVSQLLGLTACLLPNNKQEESS